tara:strand:- start:56 stop:382 length:327 start_codon:yes stop_codon:yes gene_type:complete
MALNTMLIFRNANDDAAVFPAERLTVMLHEADTTLKLKFKGSAEDTTVEEDNVDLVTLTITTGKEMEVMKHLTKIITGPGSGGIVVADDIDSVYAHADITAMAFAKDD